MKHYDTLLHELAQVPAFKPWHLTKQAVPRLPACLHPAFLIGVITPLTPLINLQNRLSFKKFLIENGEFVPKQRQGAIIFVANHSSYVDPQFVGFAISEHHGMAPWVMAKKKLWERFNYRLFFSALGALPYVRRGVDVGEHVRQLRSFVSILKSGQPLMIFPEGTIPGEIEFGRSGFCKMRSHIEAQTGLLKTGALVPLLALASGARIMPIGISGTSSFLPPEVHPAYLWPKRRKKDHVIRIKFGPVIDVVAETQALASEVTEEKLSIYANERIMPAISRLVDFNLHEPPFALPLREADYAMLRDFESRVADQYRAKGFLDHAQRVLNSSTSPRQ